MRKKNVTYWTASREMAQAYAGKNGNVYEGEFGLEHIIYSSETNPYTKKSMARMRAGRQGVKTSTDEFIVVSDPKIIKSIGKGVDVNWLDYSARRKLHKKELGLDNLVENQFINFGMVFLVDGTSPHIKVRETSNLSGRLMAFEHLAKFEPQMESWSKIIYQHLKKMNKGRGE